MEAERVFLACTDYAPVPAGLFESLSTQETKEVKIYVLLESQAAGRSLSNTGGALQLEVPRRDAP
ncbi:hypothetical protein J6590_064816 [Homalodisca vitripennis]|nr:hypothetical protein J6590_064816 [Homalodisca vitripennis]